MTKRYERLAKNFKFFRNRVDPMFSSRVIKLLFNRFIKSGKKAFAYSQMFSALFRLRTYYWNITFFKLLTYITRSFRIRFFYNKRRQGQGFLTVPFIVRRNRFVRLSIALIVSAVKVCTEHKFVNRFFRELLKILLDPSQSVATQKYYTQHETVFNERMYLRRRWK